MNREARRDALVSAMHTGDRYLSTYALSYLRIDPQGANGAAREARKSDGGEGREARGTEATETRIVHRGALAA